MSTERAARRMSRALHSERFVIAMVIGLAVILFIAGTLIAHTAPKLAAAPRRDTSISTSDMRSDVTFAGGQVSRKWADKCASQAGLDWYNPDNIGYGEMDSTLRPAGGHLLYYMWGEDPDELQSPYCQNIN